MNEAISGIHHITAICSDPQRNLDFYAGVLGLRLVKATINYDDPGTYHFYYGNAQGTPGSIITFFAWPGAQSGRAGSGQVTVTAFAIRPESIEYWSERLTAKSVKVERLTDRFDQAVLGFADPDGLQLELIGTPEQSPNAVSSVDPDHAILGFHSATLAEEGYERTASLLTATMGFQLVKQAGNRFRYAAGGVEKRSTVVDVLCAPDLAPSRVANGSVHHIAWRTPDDSTELEWRKKLVQLGYNVSPVMDRKYFHSIYYREPGGILFEIATDPPGFAVDESADALGTSLILPSWLEPRRDAITRSLLPVQFPQWQGSLK